MNQLLSNKIIAAIVALALLVGVGVLVSSGDTSSTTRNAALVVATPCTKPGQVTKVSKQPVVCAALSPKNIWYPIFKEKKWICAKLGITRKQNGIFSVCGKNKSSKKRWFLTKPLMANSNPGLPTTDQDAFIKLTTNPELIVETSPTTPLALASVTEITLAPTTETTLAATTTPTTPPASTTPAIPLTCATGGTCAIGDVGPGGGIVFYVTTTPFTCGEDLKAKCTYLEAATANGTTPSTWTPDTRAQWGCNIEDAMTSDQRAASLEIGAGRANTKIITGKNCMGEEYSGGYRPSSGVGITNSVSAASIAASYNGGGKADWFLPSRDELNEICKIYSNGRTDTTEFSDYQNGCTGNTSPTGGYSDGPYWSSSEDYTWQCENQCAWSLDFDIGGWGNNGKHGSFYVRPVRAF